MTASVITFIVPVRHQDNAANWGLAMQRLRQTIRSASAQDAPGWRGIVVANEGAALPPMPPGWQVVRVDYPPNPLHEQGGAGLEAFYDAVRLDKGRRVLAGMMAALDSEYLMVVDDDDFVSRRLAGYVATHRGQIGWHMPRGYLWEDGSRLVLLHGEFSSLCGTSHIIRRDIYDLPTRIADATDDYVRLTLGSHLAFPARLAANGTPLLSLPFPGAVYRIGHSGAHSQSKRLLPLIFEGRTGLGRLRALERLARIRPLAHALQQEFFAGSYRSE